MAKEMYSNNVSGSVNTTITSSATTLIVNGYEAFPQTGQFTVLIESEIILVTAGAGTNTWTIARGQEGTTAASHNSGRSSTRTLTDGSLRRLVRVSKAGTLTGARRELNLIEGAGITITTSDDGTNDKVDVTIAARPQEGRGRLDEAGLDRLLSWVNQGGASVAYVNDALVLVCPADCGQQPANPEGHAPGGPLHRHGPTPPHEDQRDRRRRAGLAAVVRRQADPDRVRAERIHGRQVHE
jgi:hypothetical protein